MRPSTLPGFFFFFISGKNRILFSSATQEEELDEDSIRLDQASCQVASEDGCEGWSLIDGRWLTLGATATSDRTDWPCSWALCVFFDFCFVFLFYFIFARGKWGWDQVPWGQVVTHGRWLWGFDAPELEGPFSRKSEEGCVWLITCWNPESCLLPHGLSVVVMGHSSPSLFLFPFLRLLGWAQIQLPSASRERESTMILTTIASWDFAPCVQTTCIATQPTPTPTTISAPSLPNFIFRSFMIILFGFDMEINYHAIPNLCLHNARVCVVTITLIPSNAVQKKSCGKIFVSQYEINFFFYNSIKKLKTKK